MTEEPKNKLKAILQRGKTPDNERRDVRKEIRALVNRGVQARQLPEQEAGMILSILSFADTQAQDIMTHKQSIEWIDDDSTLNATIEAMLQSGYSRCPVHHRSNADDITDSLYFKDVVKYKHKHPELGDTPITDCQGLYRKSLIVTETMDIDDLFREMQATKIQMAVCIGEYGQTVGLVSMEDILEEIVGEIHDEYDEEDRYIWPTGRKMSMCWTEAPRLTDWKTFSKQNSRMTAAKH
jgi:putative hemolysin